MEDTKQQIHDLVDQITNNDQLQFVLEILIDIVNPQPTEK